MKETKIEKLILDLSNRWDCSPQEAVDRLNSMNESEINKLINSMTKKFQVGGSIASRIWNKIKGADTYIDGYGMIRHNVPVKESAWRTTKTFANSALSQAIPIVGDLADGVNAIDYATKGDYLPAAMAIGMGFLTPDSAEVGYKGVDGDDYVARVIRERQQKAAEEAAERQAIARSSKDQYKKRARGRFSKESLEHDNPHISNIPKNRDYSGSLDRNAHDLFTGQDYVDMHENGGIIKCLKGGKTYAECKKCGGKTPVEKHQVPGQHLGEKHEYYRPSLFRQIFKTFSKNPQYQREDGLGTYSGEIKHNGDTVTVVTGPYTTFEETRTPKGERFIDSYGKDWMNRTYAPNSSSRGWFRNPADSEEVEMFDNIRKRFK